MTDLPRPLLVGERLSIRPGTRDDARQLLDIINQPGVLSWWGKPPPLSELEADLVESTGNALLVLDVGGQVVGGIQYWEEPDPQYRYAGIDIFIADEFQDRGLGEEAMRLLIGYLLDERAHRRLTIDPAAANSRAIRCYEKVGFRPVGVLREYEADGDGVFHDGLLMDLLATDLRDGPA